MKDVVVNGYSENWLRKGFPWVYPKEVMKGGAKPGSEVRLVNKRGEVLGRGLADSGWLAVRVYRHGDGPLDAKWLRGRLESAAALRDAVVDPETSGYRLIHGENDGLPGIRVDWWDHFAVIVLDSPACARWVPGIAAWLEETRSPRGIYLCYRPDPRDSIDLSNPTPPVGLWCGKPAPGPVRVTERGMAMLVDPSEGPDVGMYADMREVRAWLEPHWGGRRVLNTFSYTGAFSVAAALGGAVDVVSVDLSPKYLDRSEENFAANDLSTDNAEFIMDDVFKAMDRLRRQGRRFDLVLMDPPSFSRSKAGIWSAKRDWPKLVAGACRLLDGDGWLVCASNQGEVSPREYRGFINQGLKKAGRLGQEIYWGGQGPDFPSASWFPEGRHLKVGIWRVLGD